MHTSHSPLPQVDIFARHSTSTYVIDPKCIIDIFALNDYFKRFNSEDRILFIYFHVDQFQHSFLCVDPNFYLVLFFSAGKTYFSYSIGLPTMDYLIFCLKKRFISTSVLKTVILSQTYDVCFFVSAL